MIKPGGAATKHPGRVEEAGNEMLLYIFDDAAREAELEPVRDLVGTIANDGVLFQVTLGGGL